MTSPTATAEIERLEKLVANLRDDFPLECWNDRPAYEINRTERLQAGNAIEALLAALRAAEAERDEARAALRLALDNIQGIADGDDIPSTHVRAVGRAALHSTTAPQRQERT